MCYKQNQFKVRSICYNTYKQHICVAVFIWEAIYFENFKCQNSKLSIDSGNNIVSVHLYHQHNNYYRIDSLLQF